MDTTYRSFKIKCQKRDNVAIAYAYIGSAFNWLQPHENRNRLMNCKPVSCIFDTGSSFSYVDKSILTSILPEELQESAISDTLNGKSISKKYKVDICLPGGILFPSSVVCAMDTGFGAIVGMDIIGQGVLTIDSRSTDTILSFSIPDSTPLEQEC